MDPNTYLKSPVNGSIGSRPWTYIYAHTDAEAKRPDGIKHILVLTASKPKSGCPDRSETLSDSRELILGIDGKLGEMKVGVKTGNYETEEELFKYSKIQRQATIAFFDPTLQASDQYKFATSGKIKILKITKTLIEGQLVAQFPSDGYINGKFRAKICKWGQLN